MTPFLSRTVARRLAALTALACLSLSLSGCFVSDTPVDLGKRVQPLPAGLYASFDSKGDPDHAMVMRLTHDGRYDSEDFHISLYESGIAANVYFIAHFDEKEQQTMYGVAVVDKGGIAYPGAMCSMIPDAEKEALKLPQGDDGCPITSPEQGRKVLTAFWRVLAKDGPPDMRYGICDARNICSSARAW